VHQRLEQGVDPLAGPSHRHPGGVQETLLTEANLTNPIQRRLLLRLNAMLRMVFPLVLDYRYNRAHRDHFHCDLAYCSKYDGVTGAKACDAVRCDHGAKKGPATDVFIQEALESVLSTTVPVKWSSKHPVNQLIPAMRKATGFPLVQGADSPDFQAAFIALCSRVAKGS
jgi:hypothetical protein